MRILNVLFAVGLLAAVVFIASTSGPDMLINAQSISPSMPAMLG